MNDQELMAMAGDAPVESPFKGGESLVAGQRRKRGKAVEAKDDLSARSIAAGCAVVLRSM
jgi:hypothetical protein